MFINIREGVLKVYDVSISKRVYKLLKDLEYKTLKQHVVYEDTSDYIRNDRIIDGCIVKNFWWKDTGRYRTYNDFYCEDEAIYHYEYDLYELDEIYFILHGIIYGDYHNLELLNNSDPKYLKYVWLREKFSVDIDNELYLNLLKNTKGSLKEKIKGLDEYLGVYHMNLDKILVKTKGSK